jgi:hypothetical protein
MRFGSATNSAGKTMRCRSQLASGVGVTCTLSKKTTIANCQAVQAACGCLIHHHDAINARLSTRRLAHPVRTK